MKNINELQKEQKLWTLENFGDCPTWQPLLGIMEELGELAHAHLKQEQGIRKEEDHVVGAQDAIGDIMFFLLDYCNRRNWDLQELAWQSWSIIKKRVGPCTNLKGDNI